MPNRILLRRLEGIRQMLMAGHSAGGGSPSACKGRDREIFIDAFLSQVLPSPYRFGSGAVIDRHERSSGQLDVIIEFPFYPSVPLIVGATSRLYLAEGVAAAIEVKSDLESQWQEVLDTALTLATLRRDFGAYVSFGGGRFPTPKIPFFAVGYMGWKTHETVEKRLEGSSVDGVLLIEPGIFISRTDSYKVDCEEALALWGLICCLYLEASGLKSITANPLDYVM